jgi:hypothetical protein
MTQQITLNGNTYSDDGSVGKGMADGDFRENFVPLCADLMVEMTDHLADASGEVTEATNQATNQAQIATSQANIAIGAAASTVTGPGSTGTSTTSLTVGLGIKNFTIQTGKTLYKGMPIVIASASSPDDAMYGPLLSYDSATGATSVKVTALHMATPGVFITAASWTVSLTGASAVWAIINELKGAPIASAATINLDGATGNTLHLTGSAGPVTAVTLAQGAEREIILDGTPTFAHSANLILPTGANVIGEAGDVITFRGEGAGVTKVTGWERASGKALAVAPLIPHGYVLLADLQPSAGVSADLLTVCDGTYDNYLVIGNGIAPSGSTNTVLNVRFANAGVVDSAANYWNVGYSGGVISAAAFVTSGSVGFIYATTASTTASFELKLKNVNDAAAIKFAVCEMFAANPAGVSTVFNASGNAYKGGKVSGLRFFWSDGSNFAASGHIRVYGMRNS